MMNALSSGGNNMSTMMNGMHRRPDPSQMAKDLLSRADSDGDGSISETEFNSLLESTSDSDAETVSNLFSQLDSDSDGSINEQETTDAISALVDQMRSHVMHDQANMPPPPPPGMGQGPNAADFLSDADADGDGSLDESEFTAALQGLGGDDDSDSASRIASMFTDADSNGDGKISEDELQTSMESHRPPMPPPGQEGSGQQAMSGMDTSGNDQISFLINGLLNQYQENQSTASNISSLLSISA
jgi:Ca2+-binding EF-hand superfamily protein